MEQTKPGQTSTSSDRPGDANQQSAEQGRGLAGKSHEAATRAKDVALERVDKAKRAADAAKHRASERTRAFGAAMRSLGHHLRAGDERVIADYAERASDRIEDFASYIESAEPQQLLRDGEDLARRNPVAFFGGTFLVGLTIGRFLRSTSTGQNP